MRRFSNPLIECSAEHSARTDGSGYDAERDHLDRSSPHRGAPGAGVVPSLNVESGTGTEAR